MPSRPRITLDVKDIQAIIHDIILHATFSPFAPQNGYTGRSSPGEPSAEECAGAGGGILLLGEREKALASFLDLLLRTEPTEGDNSVQNVIP